MPKLKSVYRCQECGASSPKWTGQCPGCSAWNSMIEEAEAVGEPRKPGSARPLIDLSSDPVSLAEAGGAEAERAGTGIGELDRLLGGGLVPGQVLLVAGPPGIGKSTLMLQVARGLARSGEVLYVSGEESLAQVGGRAKRLGLAAEGILLQSETDLSRVLAAIESRGPRFWVLDSIQTVYHPDYAGSPGSVGQVRECAAELLRAAKKSGAALFLLGHVTKEGSVAGPKVLEHLVDTVLQFDSESRQMLRVLRVLKNRFGPSHEIGLFEMAGDGLREVADAAAYFIEAQEGPAPCGRAVSVAVEGSRPILVEVQALVTPTKYPLPRRMATGLDLNRVLTLVAALEKHLHLRLESQDVFVNIAGGLRLRDPGLDLAVCMSIVSSARGEPLGVDQVFIGEVGLLGRLGPVAYIEPRVGAAERAGFRGAVLPERAERDLRGRPRGKIALTGAADLAAAVERSLPC